jgi:hypothetical protein
VIDLFQYQTAMIKKIDLILNFDKNIPNLVEQTAIRLKQVLVNY